MGLEFLGQCGRGSLRARQFHGVGSLALEYSVDEDAVLSGASEEEPAASVVVGRVADLEMISRNEARVFHVDVDLSLAAAASDGHPALRQPQRVLEVPTVEPSDRRSLRASFGAPTTAGRRHTPRTRRSGP